MPSYLIWHKRIDRLGLESGDGRLIVKMTAESLMTEETLLEIEKKLDEESGGRYDNVILSFSRFEE